MSATIEPTFEGVNNHLGLDVADVVAEAGAPPDIVADNLGLDGSQLGDADDPEAALVRLIYEAGMSPADVIEQAPSVRILTQSDLTDAADRVRDAAASGYPDWKVRRVMELVAADAAYGRLTGSTRGEVVTQVQEGEGLVQFESMNNIEAEYSSPFMAAAVELMPELEQDHFFMSV